MKKVSIRTSFTKRIQIECDDLRVDSEGIMLLRDDGLGRGTFDLVAFFSHPFALIVDNQAVEEAA